MQKLPGMRRYYRLYFLLYPLAVPSLDLSPYDLVLSSSSGYAKGVRTNRDAIHVCYCHTPMRWAWSFDSYSARATWNPTKDRGVGGKDLLLTTQGLWVVSDTTHIGHETHQRVALLPEFGPA